MTTITIAQLQSIYPKVNTSFCNPLNQLLPQYGITTKQQVAAFLAQALHESQGFMVLRENLNYSAARLLAVFPTHVKDLATAQAIVARGQSAIGDVVYGGRMGNGINNGDGYKYRGGGIGDLTGKDNYKKMGDEIGMDLVNHPELITTCEGAIRSFAQWWKDNRCNDLLAAGLATPVKYDGINRVSVKVNGGTNGLPERQAIWDRGIKYLV